MPYVECKNAGAILEHEATTSRLSEDQLFYCRQRGLDEEEARARKVRQKLSPHPESFKDKSVLLIDDSLVRGTTSQKVVELVRDAGARDVYMALTSPMIVGPCIYGVDTPDPKSLDQQASILTGNDILTTVKIKGREGGEALHAAMDLVIVQEHSLRGKFEDLGRGPDRRQG